MSLFEKLEALEFRCEQLLQERKESRALQEDLRRHVEVLELRCNQLLQEREDVTAKFFEQIQHLEASLSNKVSFLSAGMEQMLSFMEVKARRQGFDERVENALEIKMECEVVVSGDGFVDGEWEMADGFMLGEIVDDREADENKVADGFVACVEGEEFGEYEVAVAVDSVVVGKEEMADGFVSGESEFEIEDGAKVGGNVTMSIANSFAFKEFLAEEVGENEATVATSKVEFQKFVVALRRSMPLAMAFMRMVLSVLWALGFGYALVMDEAVKVRALHAVNFDWDKAMRLATALTAWFPRVGVG